MNINYGAKNRKIILITLILAVFVLVVGLISIYVQEVISSGYICGCVIPLPLFIPFMASVGLFIGTLVYHLLVPVKEFVDKKAVLSLLEDEERRILEVIVNHRGKITQASIVRTTGISKIRVFRTLRRLEQRGIVEKFPHGKTNIIMLKDPYRKLLL